MRRIEEHLMSLDNKRLSVRETRQEKVRRKWFSSSDVEECRCPLCDSDSPSTIYTEREILRIVRCNICQLIYVSPRLKNPEQVYYGREESYLKESRLIFEGKAGSHRDPNYQEHLRVIARFKPRGRFLDVGSNMGLFLRNAIGKGWELFGVEPSPTLSKIARDRFKLNVKTAFLEEAKFPSEYFDIVCLTDVFEHIKEPKQLLLEIHRILLRGGIVYINVPNGRFNLFKLILARCFRRTRDYNLFDSYEHVVHYTHETLVRMVETYGFQTKTVCIGLPIQLPVWHLYVGDYYQYPSPWVLDPLRQTLRILFHRLSLIEYYLRGRRVGWLAPNITIIAVKQ
jgi:SAM-dependent methyltransferase